MTKKQRIGLKMTEQARKQFPTYMGRIAEGYRNSGKSGGWVVYFDDLKSPHFFHKDFFEPNNMSHSKKKTYKGWAIVSKRGAIQVDFHPFDIWRTKQDAECSLMEERGESIKRVTITIED